MTSRPASQFWVLLSPEGKRFVAVPEEEARLFTGDGPKAEEEPDGKRLKLLRVKKGLTQAQLAEMSGLSQGQVSRIEAGKSGEQYKETISSLFKKLS